MRLHQAEPRPGWSTATRPRRPSGRRVLLALSIVGLLGGLFVATPAQPVSGDELAAAIARQKALQQQLKDQKSQVAAIDRQQAEIQARIASTRVALAGVNADLTVVEGQVADLADTITVGVGELHLLTVEVRQLDTQLASLTVQEARKQAELDARRELLAARIRNAYDDDRTPLLETLLSRSSFTDLLAQIGYELDVAAQDKALAQQIMRDQEVLQAIHETVLDTRAEADSMRAATADRQATLDAEMDQLRSAQADLEALKRKTAAALAEQQAAYATLARNEAKLRDAIAAGEKAEEQLSAKVAELVRLQSRGGGVPSKYSGTLAWPMAGVITQEFGCTGFYWEPRLGSCAHFHRGIDIAAPLYTPIRASGPGVVVFAGANPYDPSPKAWIVIIAHSEHLVTWYAHIDNRSHPPTVRAGDRVVAGQIIAYEGLTGRTTGPHLHWAVQLDGTFVNPRLFL
jgi:murein DD-endopeptidase MepM/ murein hydrolase activator NlpD